jgi:glutaredoxin
MKDFTIYTMATCAACKAVKERLSEHKIKFKEIMIYRDIAMEGFKYRFPDAATVPVILMGTEQIPYSKLMAEDFAWEVQ